MGHLTLETENVLANALLSDVTIVFTIISRKDSSSELGLWSRDACCSNPISWLDMGNLWFLESASRCQIWRNFRNTPIPLSPFSRQSCNVFILLLSLSGPSIQNYAWLQESLSTCVLQK